MFYNKYLITREGALVTVHNNELYHYGVKGMKWGVRRYQNEDGSLTDAGKERYYNDTEQKKLYEQSKRHIDGSKYSGYVKQGYMIRDNDDLAQAGAFLCKQNEIITDIFNQMSKSYDRDISAMRKNSKFMSEAKKRLTDELGGPDQVDDEDLLDFVIDDFIYENLHKYSSQTTKDLSSKFSKSVTQYYDNAKAITDDIVGNYGDRTVATIKTAKNVQNVSYKDAVENTIHDVAQSAWVRYMNNHTEATWIDSDSIPEVASAIKKEFGYTG